jgi:hypothetical protein
VSHTINGNFSASRSGNTRYDWDFSNTNAGSSAGPGITLTADGGSAVITKNSDANATGAAAALRVINESAGVYLANGGTSWASLSDMRHKTKVAELGDVLDGILGLSVFTYQTNEALAAGEAPVELGLSAQEMLSVAPQIVTGTEDTQYGISYDRLGVVLVRAIQEQQAMIDDLKAELAALKGN